MRTYTAIFLPLLLGACQQPANVNGTEGDLPGTQERTTDTSTKQAPYDVRQWFPGDQADTLLANMITFIYKRPRAATNATRIEPQFRQFYVDQLPAFKYAYHHKGDDDIHYFYLIRPARSVEGDERGVGGRFKVDEQLHLVEFEELFNTRIMSEDALLEKGLLLFHEMIATGDVDVLLEDRSLIEWPDDRLKYDREKREWRYID